MYLLPWRARRLMGQLAADCALLEELRVMDYSLLLGVHFRNSGWTSSPPVTDRVRASSPNSPLKTHPQAPCAPGGCLGAPLDLLFPLKPHLQAPCAPGGCLGAPLGLLFPLTAPAGTLRSCVTGRGCCTTPV